MLMDELFQIAAGGFREIQKDWMRATAVRPFAFDDPAIVWLDFHGEENGFKPDKSPYDFLDFISVKGRQFEEKWIKELAASAVAVCREDYEVRTADRLFETIAHLYSGTPLIAKPALWWAPERIYGVPDLIAHTSWISERFPQLITQYERESIPVNVDSPSKPGHYVVFDIKFTTRLEETEKKRDFANCAAQVRIYSFVLGCLQGLVPRNGYLFTRDHLTAPLPVRVTSIVNAPLDDDLAAYRNQFAEIKLNGSKYRPWRDKIVNSNISNDDERWQTAKDLIAREKYPGRDPTLLYQVSPSVREELGAMGFASLDSMLSVDPARVPFEKCKGLGPKRSQTMRCILEANRAGAAIRPTASTVPVQKDHEFFVDFEYLVNVNVDFEKQWPTLQGCEMVLMIGMGWNTDKGWSFRSFVAEAENAEEERKMFLRFLELLNQETQGALTDPTKSALYHWTGAEVWQARRAANRNSLAADHQLRMLPWFDLQKYFVEGAAALPGAWSHGLKEVARALGQLNTELAVQWPGNLDEGLRAMVMGWRAYSNSNPLNSEEMGLLQEYLEVDCAALSKVLKWMRSASYRTAVP